MKYVVDAREMKLFEETVIEMMGIPSLVLMERAALAVAAEIQAYAGTRLLREEEKVFWWWPAAATMGRMDWPWPGSCQPRAGR